MDTIEITLPVTRAAAERLSEPAERARLGALVSLAMASEATAGELAEAAHLLGAAENKRRTALREAFADMQQAAAEAGITPEELEEELAAWRRERTEDRTGDTAARRR